MQSTPAWESACDKIKEAHCGRLDMSTYDVLSGEAQRFVYLDDRDRVLVQGPDCDLVAYMAARYPDLKRELAEARARAVHSDPLQSIIQWVPVTERMPPFDVPVFVSIPNVFGEGSHLKVAKWDSNRYAKRNAGPRWIDANLGCLIRDHLPTHWALYPSTP